MSREKVLAESTCRSIHIHVVEVEHKEPPAGRFEVVPQRATACRLPVTMSCSNRRQCEPCCPGGVSSHGDCAIPHMRNRASQIVHKSFRTEGLRSHGSLATCVCSWTIPVRSNQRYGILSSIDELAHCLGPLYPCMLCPQDSLSTSHFDLPPIWMPSGHHLIQVFLELSQGRNAAPSAGVTRSLSLRFAVDRRIMEHSA